MTARKKFDVLVPPEEGNSYELDATFLDDVDKKKPGEPVTYWLFMRRIKGDRVQRFIHELKAADAEEATRQLREIAERADVKLVAEQTRKEVEKAWLKEES